MARAVVTGVSLLPREKRALDYLAEKHERGNRSGFIARLIVKAAKEDIGRDWEVVVAEAPTRETEKVPA